MDFRLTDEQELLIQTIDEMFARELPESYFADCDKHHQPLKKYEDALRDYGLATLGIPEEYGGTPSDYLTMCLVGERIAYHACPVGFQGMLCVKDILDFGTEEQKKVVLDLVMSGIQPFALGISEPAVGSDTAAIAATATKQADGTVIFNGQKTLVTHAATAPYILLMTRDFSIDNPHKAISMWLVPLDLPGFTVQPMEKAVTWTTNTCDVFIDNVRAPQSCLVGQENNGFLQLMKNFEIERLMLCSTGLGYAEAAFEDAAVYANQRVQFGQPIGYNQQIQLMLANMAVKIENMKNMIYKTVWMLDHDMPVVKETAMAKLYCGQSCCEVIDDAIQIYGALGLMSDVRLQRMWRDARTLRIGGGADQIMVNILGKTILKEHRNAKDRK